MPIRPEFNLVVNELKSSVDRAASDLEQDIDSLLPTVKHLISTGRLPSIPPRLGPYFPDMSPIGLDDVVPSDPIVINDRFTRAITAWTVTIGDDKSGIYGRFSTVLNEALGLFTRELSRIIVGNVQLALSPRDQILAILNHLSWLGASVN